MNGRERKVEKEREECTVTIAGQNKQILLLFSRQLVGERTVEHGVVTKSAIIILMVFFQIFLFLEFASHASNL